MVFMHPSQDYGPRKRRVLMTNTGAGRAEGLDGTGLRAERVHGGKVQCADSEVAPVIDRGVIDNATSAIEK